MRLVLIGLVAGFFSALFGVGGGIVMVPLLILVARFSERPAMATSLASIGVIALVGTISYTFHGDVHLGYGLLLGLPAAVGAVAGSSLQQRLTTPVLTLGFAGLLTAGAVIQGGTIGFIGLVIPHLVRLAFGTAAHRIVAPAAALAGGTLLAAADLVARTAAAPRQLPVGAIMALLGVPMFLVLLRRLEGPRPA